MLGPNRRELLTPRITEAPCLLNLLLRIHQQKLASLTLDFVGLTSKENALVAETVCPGDFVVRTDHEVGNLLAIQLLKTNAELLEKFPTLALPLVSPQIAAFELPDQPVVDRAHGFHPNAKSRVKTVPVFKVGGPVFGTLENP